MKERYTDFKQNQTYHDLRRSAEGDEKYCRIRHLDLKNEGTTKKTYYSSEILRFFDKHYSK